MSSGNLLRVFEILEEREIYEILSAVNEHTGKIYHEGNLPFLDFETVLLALTKRSSTIKPFKKVPKLKPLHVPYTSKNENLNALPVEFEEKEIVSDHFLLIAQILTKLNNPNPFLIVRHGYGRF